MKAKRRTNFIVLRFFIC